MHKKVKEFLHNVFILNKCTLTTFFKIFLLLKYSTFKMSTEVRIILATSTATFPCPRTATVSQSSFTCKSLSSGSPLYHPTNLRADTTFSRFSPSIPSSLSCSAPYDYNEHSLCNTHICIKINICICP